MDSVETARLSYDVTEPAPDLSDKKAPIILLHGMTSTKETWGIFKKKLADSTGRTVYTYDARNHGDSEWKEPHSYLALVKDLSRFMDEMHIPTAILVGHSMGGKTAMLLATTEPSKVERLAIEDISPSHFKPEFLRFPQLYIKLMKKALEVVSPELDIEAAKNKVYDFILSVTPKEQRSAKTIARDWAAPTLPLEKTPVGFRWKVNFEALENMVHHTPLTLSGTYNGPVVFIYGTRSPYNVFNDRDVIQGCFPEATFVPVEGATHLVHYEYPEEFLKATLDFINK